MSSVADVIAPTNDEGTKATILRWSRQIGDVVGVDEPLLELETDKVTVEIASPAAGELIEILKGPNEEVLPGQVLARVRIAAAIAAQAAGEAPADPRGAESLRSESSRMRLSPAVRRLLAEHGLAAHDITGSGRDGRITAQDVAAHLDEGDAPGLRTETQRGVDAAAVSRLAHTPMRRRIAEHMLRSLAESPHVTTLFEADLTRVHAHRARHTEEFARRGVRLTLTAYFIAACARALRAHPQVNATFRDDALELHADVNIGVGTALGNDGLIVPVLRRASSLDLFAIALRLGQLVAAARAGNLTPPDVRGGTFTISNHGVGGSLLAAPIVINQPQVAILGVGKVERRVRVLPIDGAETIAVRSMCYLTLTIDHRALDAFQANAFLASIVAALEQWPEG